MEPWDVVDNNPVFIEPIRKMTGRNNLFGDVNSDHIKTSGEKPYSYDMARLREKRQKIH